MFRESNIIKLFFFGKWNGKSDNWLCFKNHTDGDGQWCNSFTCTSLHDTLSHDNFADLGSNK